MLHKKVFLGQKITELHYQLNTTTVVLCVILYKITISFIFLIVDKYFGGNNYYFGVMQLVGMNTVIIKTQLLEINHRRC